MLPRPQTSHTESSDDTQASHRATLLPKGWTEQVRSALLHAISLASMALTAAHSRAATSRVR